MPRLSKSVPRYCKHRASGQAVVTLNGKDIYLGRYGSRVSRMEYDRLIAEWLAHGRRLPDEEDQEPLSVAELALAYGLERAQVVLGHARANVTQVYAGADRTLAARIAEEIG